MGYLASTLSENMFKKDKRRCAKGKELGKPVQVLYGATGLRG
jgi:hypothetical protein